MPRKARQKSNTGIYHIIIRGINRQDIFHDDEDKGVYLDRLSKYKADCGFEIYAYCLMGNHMHLLLKEGKTGISGIMKRIGTSYVYWYNRKYDRTGHLFQDRYKSEPIEDDSYLLTVTRYIHQNPVKIGLSIDSWTSYNDYLGNGNMTDTKPVLELFNLDIIKARNIFIEYVSEPNSDVCLEISETKRVTDKEAERLAKKLKLKNFQEIQQTDKPKRDMILKELKDAGLSIRQLERLTGISRGVILKA